MNISMSDYNDRIVWVEFNNNKDAKEFIKAMNDVQTNLHWYAKDVEKSKDLYVDKKNIVSEKNE